VRPQVQRCQAAQNPVFRRVIEEIRDALARQSAFLNELGGRREQSNREHRAIVEALMDGSELDAVDAMAHHLDRVETTLTAWRAPVKPCNSCSPIRHRGHDDLFR